jgi:hypothetical protein
MKVLKAVPTGMKHFYRLLDAAANERLRDWYRENEGQREDRGEEA